MFRFCEQKINDWLLNKNNSLLITGARQVGKTYIIRDVLKKNNIPYFEINFFDRPDILEVLRGINNTKEFIERIRLYSPTTLEGGKSVIFFDEIQEFPEIITKIKFLVDEGSFKYILSGSLLGVELKNIRSVPVGYMEEIKMYPMNFTEFLISLNVKQETLDYLVDSFKNLKPIDSLIHDKIMNLFHYYLVTGGMPKVVLTFIETKNLYRVDEEQKNIINQYKADFSKYEVVDKKLRILSIYDNIASQLNKQNLKFIFTYLNKNLKFDRYENSFLWLKDAGVAYPTYIVNEVKSPLIMSKDKNTFKLFYNDVGLLVANYPFSTKMDIINNNETKVNKGALYENFVAQELVSNDLTPYYFKNSKIGEIDFLVETDLFLNVLEIKSGKEYKKHTALNNLLKDNSELKNNYVFGPCNIEKCDRITYLPIYLVGLIKNEERKDYFININTDNI